MSEILGGIVHKASMAISDGTGLAIAVVGAGAGSAIVEVVKSWFPEQTANIADETLAAAVGFALFYFGDKVHRYLTSFGFGLFMAAVGAWSSTFTASIIQMLKKK
jgi:hypothetical protein